MSWMFFLYTFIRSVARSNCLHIGIVWRRTGAGNYFRYLDEYPKQTMLLSFSLFYAMSLQMLLQQLVFILTCDILPPDAWSNASFQLCVFNWNIDGDAVHSWFAWMLTLSLLPVLFRFPNRQCISNIKLWNSHVIEKK